MLPASIIKAYNEAAEERRKEEHHMTNADKVRQMTDEELADIMQGQCACCAYQLTGCTERECKDGAYKWLKQEAREDARTD